MKKILFIFMGLLGIAGLVACSDTKVNEGSNSNPPEINYESPEITQGSVKYIMSLAVDISNAKVNYYLTENFSQANVKVIASYNDSSTEDVTSKVTFDSSAFNSQKEGTYTINVIYDDGIQQLYSSYNVVVNNMVDLITSDTYAVGLTVDLTGVSTQLRYDVENIDFSNINANLYRYNQSLDRVVNTTYSVGSDERFSIDTSAVDLTHAGYYFVTVNYTDSYDTSVGIKQTITVSSSFMVQVINPLVEINFVSGNQEVDQYANLDYSNWIVNAKYESGLEEQIDANLLEVNYNLYLVGEQDAVVSYTEYGVTKTTTVKINVIEASLSFTSLFFTTDDLALSDSISSVTSWVDSDNLAPNMFSFTGGSKVTANSKDADGYSFTKRLQLQGKSQIIFDSAMFNGKTITIKLYAMSGTSSEDRTLDIYDDAYTTGTLLTTLSFSGTSLVGQEYTLTCDGGMYYIGGTAGVNVYGILITVE